MAYSLINDGFAIVEGALSHPDLEELRGAVARLPSRHRGGARNLLQHSEFIAAMATAQPVKALADAALGADAFPVRALLFDKARAANWKVPWHQDTAIAVAERMDAPGFMGWSVKDGVTHVHPPADILERMVALRIHLDHCGLENGPLRVLPGSHRHGKLDEEEIEHWRRTTEEVSCCVAQGDVLVLRPLLLHASSPAQSPSHRRVIQVEYACGPLPAGLRWFERPTQTFPATTADSRKSRSAAFMPLHGSNSLPALQNPKASGLPTLKRRKRRASSRSCPATAFDLQASP